MSRRHARLLVGALVLGLMSSCLSGCFPYRLTVRPEITGTVLDADSHAPIAGAKIYCSGHPDAAAITSVDGGFDLPPVKGWQIVVLGADYFPLGCELVAEAAGYDPGKDWTNATGDVIYLHRSAGSN